MNTAKLRLDIVLVERGFCDSLRQAQAFVMDGKILVNDQKLTKPGTLVSQTCKIRVLGHVARYVSRAGDKLHSAWEQFQFEIKDRVALDIGLSTGGFTDFLRSQHVRCVFGVDVSYGIVDFQLRQWPGLLLLERTNARYVTPELLKQTAENSLYPNTYKEISLVVMDVSFISVTTIIPTILNLVQPYAEFVLLIKPQFEATLEELPEGGVIEDPDMRCTIVNRVKHKLQNLGLTLKQECASGVVGTKGNQEYFLWLTLNPKG